MTTTVELLSSAGNIGVVQLPGRRFPALVIQGDTLSIIVDQSRKLCALIPAEAAEAREEAEFLQRDLEKLQEHYEATLAAHGLQLPYSQH